MNLYIHSPIRLHGVVLNWLSTGTTLLVINHTTYSNPEDGGNVNISIQGYIRDGISL
jgi:hypothetical protein